MDYRENRYNLVHYPLNLPFIHLFEGCTTLKLRFFEKDSELCWTRPIAFTRRFGITVTTTQPKGMGNDDDVTVNDVTEKTPRDTSLLFQHYGVDSITEVHMVEWMMDGPRYPGLASRRCWNSCREILNRGNKQIRYDLHKTQNIIIMF